MQLAPAACVWQWFRPVVLLVSLPLTGCAEHTVPSARQPPRPSEAKKIEKAREWVKDAVSRVRSDQVTVSVPNDAMPAREQYLIDNYSRALKSLEHASVRDFVNPIPIVALIRPGNNDPIVLEIVCLSAKLDISRVYIADSKGATLVQGPLKILTDEEDEEAIGMIRWGGTAISVSGTYKSELPLLTLDRTHLSEELWVGVVDDDGTRSKPIRAFVAPEIHNSGVGPESKDVHKPIPPCAPSQVIHE